MIETELAADCQFRSNHIKIKMFSNFSDAFTARAINENCFQFVRKFLKKQLPSDAELDQWHKCNKNIFKSEHFQIILNKNLNYICSNLTNKERKCSLQFHECDVRVFKDEPSEYKRVLFGMIRGLFHKWFHVFIIEFDHDFNEATIYKSLDFLHSVNLDVVALITTWYQTNDCWKKLGVSMEKPFIEYPSSNQKIFVFPDMPTLLNILKDYTCKEDLMKGAESEIQVSFEKIDLSV